MLPCWRSVSGDARNVVRLCWMKEQGMFYFVRLWRDLNTAVPSIQERVQAPSEGHAVVQVMRRYHLKRVDRAHVGPSAAALPTVRLVHVVVAGGKRFWKREL